MSIEDLMEHEDEPKTGDALAGLRAELKALEEKECGIIEKNLATKRENEKAKDFCFVQYLRQWAAEKRFTPSETDKRLTLTYGENLVITFDFNGKTRTVTIAQRDRPSKTEKFAYVYKKLPKRPSDMVGYSGEKEELEKKIKRTNERIAEEETESHYLTVENMCIAWKDRYLSNEEFLEELFK